MTEKPVRMLGGRRKSGKRLSVSLYEGERLTFKMMCKNDREKLWLCKKTIL